MNESTTFDLWNFKHFTIHHSIHEIILKFVDTFLWWNATDTDGKVLIQKFFLEILFVKKMFNRSKATIVLKNNFNRIFICSL